MLTRTTNFFLFSVLIIFFSGCAHHRKSSQFHSLRLKPGQDVRAELEKLTQEKGLKAGAIVSAVGSLSKLSLRLANQRESTKRVGFFEVVSLSGTLSPDGPHLHLAAADEKGVTVGGHLTEGNLVYTTLELVIVEPSQTAFHRREDPATGYKELVVDSE